MPNGRSTWLAFIALLIGSLVLHAVLACYSHPMADDFSYAHKNVAIGAWSAALWEYQHWNGRYASNFLVLFGPLRLGLDHLLLYRAVPVLLIALTLFAQVLFMHALLRSMISGAHASALALIWCALYLFVMPDIPEGFYWYTGAITYQLPSALFLIYATLLINGRMNAPRLFLAAVLLFAIIGFNEVIMLLMVVLHIALLWGWRSTLDRSRLPAVLLSAVVIAGAAIMVLAPGNAGRSAYFPERHHLLMSIGMSALQTVRFFGSWVCSIPVLALSLFQLLHHRAINERLGLILNKIKPWMTLVALPVVIFLCVFPAYWSTGILGQHRTVNVACFFFLPLWFLNIAVCSNAWLKNFTPIEAPVLEHALLLLAVAAILFTRNGYDASIDLFTGRAARASEQLEHRYSLLRKASSSGTTAAIPSIADPPRSLYLLDIRDEPDHIANKNYARWFGLKEVLVSSDDQSDAAKAVK